MDIAGHSLSCSYSLSLPLPLSLSLPPPSLSLSSSHTLSLTPSLPPGPLASRRGDRIISEAFARFLPPSPSSVFFLPARRGESLIIVTGHGASSFTYSVELVSSFSLSCSIPYSVRVFSRLLSLSPPSSSLSFSLALSSCVRCPLYNTLCPSAF